MIASNETESARTCRNDDGKQEALKCPRERENRWREEDSNEKGFEPSAGENPYGDEEEERRGRKALRQYPPPSLLFGPPSTSSDPPVEISFNFSNSYLLDQTPS